MPYKTFQAIVLQRVDWRENDRILTLFSPEHGRVDVLCRSCRKPKSPLMSAAELFTMGEYVVFSGKGRDYVQSCSIIESFYPLRLDYARLAAAAMMASACLKTIQPEEPMGHLYILLARSFRRLAFEDSDITAVTSAFLLHFITLQGFKPRLNHCVRCQKRMGDAEGGYLMEQEDGICCAACAPQANRRSWLSAEQTAWLRDVLVLGIDKISRELGAYPLGHLKRYTEYQLETNLPDLPKQ
ncbi:MAG: DNA repair protein RecO [Clostridiales bacterium]|nr:DNA repair protein RecO [Clostridiales bacterium]